MGLELGDDGTMNESVKPEQGGAGAETPAASAMVQPQCPACGRPEQIVWVHGHGQCAHCKMNVMPCCDGATCCD